MTDAADNTSNDTAGYMVSYRSPGGGCGNRCFDTQEEARAWAAEHAGEWSSHSILRLAPAAGLPCWLLTAELLPADASGGP